MKKTKGKRWAPVCCRLILLLLVIGSVQGLQAQTGILKGLVTDAKTNDPLEGATVSLYPVGLGDAADTQGVYEVIDVPTGTWQMVVSHLGYESYQRKVIINNGQTVKFDVALEPKSKPLDEVVVSGTSSSDKPFPVNLIKKNTIEILPVTDIGTLLRETPNIGGIRKGGTNLDPVVRGFKFSQLNVQLNEGIKIEGGCPNRMDPATSHVDINDIVDIEVYKGPYALRFGPVLGGVIRLKTIKTPDYSKFTSHISAIQGFESNRNGMHSHLTVDGGNKWFFFKLLGNYNKAGDYKAGNGDWVRAAFTKYNFAGTVGLTPAKGHAISVGIDRSFGRNIDFPALPMDERSDDTRIISLDYEGLDLGKHWNTIRISAYHTQVDHVMDNKQRPFSDTVVAVSTIAAIDYGYRAETGFSFGANKILVGTDFEQILKDGNRKKSLILQPNLPTKVEKLWNDALIRNIGIFTQYSVLWGRAEITAAARLDFNHATCRSMSFYAMNGSLVYDVPDVTSDLINFSISAGLHYAITDAIALNFALGRSMRSPDMVERFIMLLPIGYDDFDYIGNPQLKSEINNQADLTATYTCINSGDFSGNVFFSIVQDYITGKEIPPSVVKPQTKDVVGVKQFINTDYVYLYGFEFSWNTPNHWKLGINAQAACTWGTNPSATKYIIQNGQVTGEEQVKNDPLAEIPPLEGSTSIYYQFLKSSLIPKITLRFVAPQNRISQAYNESKTPGFALAGISLSYKYNKVFTIAAGVDNIFNTAYYEHLNRRIIGTDDPLYEPGRVFFANLIFNL
jgi:iron complex outermembrane recepter protein